MAKRSASTHKPGGDGPTLAETVTRLGMIEKSTTATQTIIAKAVELADAKGRTELRVVSCHTCTAPKACCSLPVKAYLHEALPIAARLIALGRDTPDLRAALRAAAEAMENTARGGPRRPCAFLDGDERCTVYEVRPSACGTALVYSPAELCSAPGPHSVVAFRGPIQREVPLQVEARVRADLGLTPTDHVFTGALPRMVLLCLQAWNRADFVRFFAQHGPAAASNLERALGGRA